ncbi:tripartite motif-containing protein 3, partial [Biomphalaria glabrata]
MTSAAKINPVEEVDNRIEYQPSRQVHCDFSFSPAKFSMAHSASAALDASNSPATNRILFVDENKFLEEFLSCSLCHERYNQKERAPKLLTCNHTFCLTCLLKTYEHAKELYPVDDSVSRFLQCPICRKDKFFSRKSIKALPNDHRVIQMTDFLAQITRNSPQVCTRHKWQPINFFCKKCLMPICRDCTVIDHKEVDGHTLSDISEAMQENLSGLIDLEIKSGANINKLRQKLHALDVTSKRLDTLNRNIICEIEHAFKEYRMQLTKRQTYLTSKATDMIKEQKNTIKSRFDSVFENTDELQKLYDDFKDSRANNDVLKIFSLAQQLRNRENGLSEMASLDDNELFQSCKFDSQGEDRFLADISDLGEIKSIVDPSLKESIIKSTFFDFEKYKKKEK